MSKVKRVLFTPDLLIRLTRGTFSVVENAIPPTARVRDVHYDVDRGAVSLTVEDESFADVPLGDVIPIALPPTIRTELPKV